MPLVQYRQSHQAGYHVNRIAVPVCTVSMPVLCHRENRICKIIGQYWNYRESICEDGSIRVIKIVRQ